MFKDRTTKEVFKFGPTQLAEMVAFLDTVDVLIMHNGVQYDLPLLLKILGYKFKGKIVDTLLMSRLQFPKRQLPITCLDRKTGPHSVAAWGYRVGRGKPDHDDWSQYSPEMLHRCSEDVEIQELIFDALMLEGKGKDWKQAHLLTFKLFEILALQEAYGWLVDQPYMAKSISLLTHMIDRVDRSIQDKLPMVVVIGESKPKGVVNYVKKPFLKSGGHSASVVAWLGSFPEGGTDGNIVGGPFSRITFRRTNLNSNAETKEFLLGSGWIPEAWNVSKETGERTSPKLNHSDPFLGIQGGVGRLVARRVQARHRRSQIEGWFKRIRPDGRVPARVTGLAETGRAKHADIVNVPGGEAFFGKQMRACFTSPEGFVLVGCDSAGCQNRMLAARVGDPSFTETLINGDKKKGTAIHQVNQKAIREVAGIEVSYGIAKNLNYAFMFGASDNKLGAICGMNKEAGTRIREALLSVAAGFTDLVERLTKEWRSNAKRRPNRWGGLEHFNGHVVGLDGRPIFIPSEHQILVYVLQSDEAIHMSAAYCMLHKRLCNRYAGGVDFKIVCFYHDEYTIECKEEISKDVAEVAEQCIVDAGKYYKIACPHEGEAAIGKTWWDIH